MKPSVKFITAIYSDLFGSEFGGRPNRYWHYRWSLLSLLKMTDADFVCYTSDREYEDLKTFFFIENNVNKEKLKIVVSDLNKNRYSNLINKYKDVEKAKVGDRCLEIQYMKFEWFNNEDMSYDYYFWIDAGLSHCGLLPNKYLSLTGNHNKGYYESNIFNNVFLRNLVRKTENKFTIIAKENDRNYWSGTVNPIHYKKYDRSYHVIGGLFGGKKELWKNIVDLFNDYLTEVTISDNNLYFEEHIMSLMYRNHEELFHSYSFDIWWHEDERIPDFDIIAHTKKNKSFYKIIEELNNE
jgi:hypothetical protein